MDAHRKVKYAGISITEEENGEKHVQFHTSNKVRYAIATDLPKSVAGRGRAITFCWYKMPPKTTTKEALEKLAHNPKLKDVKVVQDVLQEKLERATNSRTATAEERLGKLFERYPNLKNSKVARELFKHQAA